MDDDGESEKNWVHLYKNESQCFLLFFLKKDFFQNNWCFSFWHVDKMWSNVRHECHSTSDDGADWKMKWRNDVMMYSCAVRQRMGEFIAVTLARCAQGWKLIVRQRNQSAWAATLINGKNEKKKKDSLIDSLGIGDCAVLYLSNTKAKGIIKIDFQCFLM